jgi:hypothetical protein
MTERNHLPQRRVCETFEIRKHGIDWIVSVGFYGDMATPGEVFISGARAGTDLDGIARDAAITISIALQHGANASTMAHAITRNQDGTPSTIIGDALEQLGKMI